MSLLRTISYFLSAVLFFLGIIFMIASVYEPIRIVPGLFMLLVAGALIYFTLKGKEIEQRRKMLEVEVIRYAKKSGGKVTVAEVASALNVPVEVAEEVLKSLERKGLAYLDFEKIGEEGVMVYRILGVGEDEL